ncbi:MAG: 50S ribosomal protein L24 [Candidatus Spechtbacterales bacterium]
MKIKTGDKVLVTKGKSRGKAGKVTATFPRDKRVIVDGANLQKKHVRPRKQDEKGQVVEMAAPVQVSNVKLICPNCEKPSRIGYKIEGDKKYRVCKNCDKALTK